MANTYTDTFVGEDTLIINGRVLSNFGFGTVVEITCPNAIAGVDIGKGGNAVFSLQENGRQADVKVLVMILKLIVVLFIVMLMKAFLEEKRKKMKYYS